MLEVTGCLDLDKVGLR